MEPIDHGIEQLTAAAQALAHGVGPLEERLQAAWVDQLENLWSSVYLPDDLNERFRRIWNQFTDTSLDPHSSSLKTLSGEDLAAAVDAVLGLAFDAVAARAAGRPAGEPPRER